MNRREIRERVEEALQDIDNRRWTNSELNRYIDDAQREFVRISRQPQVTATVALAASGAATAVAGTTTVASKTVTVTTSSDHGLSTGDVIVVENNAHVITKVSETIFRYIVDGTQTAGSIQFISYNPSYTVPDSIEEIVSATLDGLNVSIMSEGELDAAVFRHTSGGAFMDTVFGVVPNPFTTIRSNYATNATPKWREYSHYRHKTQSCTKIRMQIPKFSRILYCVGYRALRTRQQIRRFRSLVITTMRRWYLVRWNVRTIVRDKLATLKKAKFIVPDS